MKLNKLEKFILGGAVVATFALAACPVKADLGDTKEQSVKRYGKPFLVVKDLGYYKTKAFIVCHWFNEDGVAEVICYFKMKGNLTQENVDVICALNLEGTGVKTDDWLEQESNESNTKVWTTLDGNLGFTRGPVKLGKYFYDSVSIGTVRGMLKIVGAGKEENKVKISEYQNI